MNWCVGCLLANLVSVSRFWGGYQFSAVGGGSASEGFAGGVQFFIAEPSMSAAAGRFCGFAGHGRVEYVGDEFSESLSAGGIIASLIAESLTGDLQDAFL